MELWCVQNGQVMMTIPEVSYILVYEEAKYLVLKKFGSYFFTSLFCISGRTTGRFCIAL